MSSNIWTVYANSLRTLCSSIFVTRCGNCRMDFGIGGGGIYGLCCAWHLAERGHRVTLYDCGGIMHATSRASSKLLHGGLRYLENWELRLVREALRERDTWLKRAPAFAWPIRLTLPIYRGARRPRWMIGLGLFAYDHIAGRTELPHTEWRTAGELINRDPRLASEGLIGGYDYSDGQIDDLAPGRWEAAGGGSWRRDPGGVRGHRGSPGKIGHHRWC